jgi:hypothetical protein
MNTKIEKTEIKAKASIEAPIVLTPDQIAMIAAAGAETLFAGNTIISGGIKATPFTLSVKS